MSKNKEDLGYSKIDLSLDIKKIKDLLENKKFQEYFKQYKNLTDKILNQKEELRKTLEFRHEIESLDKEFSSNNEVKKFKEIFAQYNSNQKAFTVLKAIADNTYKSLQDTSQLPNFNNPQFKLAEFSTICTKLKQNPQFINAVKKDAITEIAKQYPAEAINLRKIYEFYNASTNPIIITSYKDLLGKNLGIQAETLHNIFNPLILPLLKAKHNIELKITVKPLKQLLTEMVLGSDKENSITNGNNADILELENKYHKVKELYEQRWQSKTAQEIAFWAKQKKQEKLGNSNEAICEAIAVMDRANELLTGGHHFRDTQILSVLIFLQTLQGKGKLCQINTGEGKTLIVSLLATIKILQGEKIIDIITSNQVLAAEGVKEKANFYKLFGINVTTNNAEENYISGPRECYKADIVYGCISNFQFDYLRDSFEGLKTRANREFGYVILDEVDSMLIDNCGHIAKLSGPFPGMESLRYIYIKIWQELCSSKDNSQRQIKNKVLKSEIIESDIVPKHLKEYAKVKLDRWIKNAVYAKNQCNENEQYIIKEKEGENVVIPVDYANTGVTLKNTIWSHGLHQFVQLKHNLYLTAESLTSSFISNAGYIKKYGNKMFGLTGTLGSKAEQDLLSHIYNVDYAKIPTYKQKKFVESLGKVANDGDWITAITREVKEQISNSRAVLIVCRTIKDLKDIQPHFKNARIYADEDNVNVTEEVVNPGDVIIATNIAGRGTDFKTSKELEKNGGLHVCVGFLPCNKRVEDQAFGRTSRQGNDGSANLIIKAAEVTKLKIVGGIDFQKIKNSRDALEQNRINDIKNVRLKEIDFHDALFTCFSNLYSTLKKEKKILINPEFNYVLEDLKEHWAFWLEKQNFKGNNLPNQQAAQTTRVQTEFENFKSQSKEIINGVITHNPYYSIQQGENFLQSNQTEKAAKSLNHALFLTQNSDILYSAYIKLFEVSIAEAEILTERFKQAIAQVAIFGHFVNVKNEQYKVNAKQYLEKAKEALNKEKAELNYIQQGLYKDQDFSNLIIASSKNEINIFLKHVHSRLVCLNTYLENIDSVLKQLKECNVTKGIAISSRITDYFKDLKPEIDHEGKLKEIITKSEVAELDFIGLNTIYALKEIHDVPKQIIERAQGQIGGGIAALTAGIAFPPSMVAMAPIASALITEGICDIVIELIRQGDSKFSEKEYVKEKLISYGTSIATMGISAVVMCTQMLQKTIKVCQGAASIFRKTPFAKIMGEKIVGNIEKLAEGLIKIKSQKLLKLEKTEKFTAVAKNLNKEVVKGVTGSLISEGVTKGFEQILQNLKPKIEAEVRKIINSQIKKYQLKLVTKEHISTLTNDLLDGSYGEIAVDVLKEIVFRVLGNTKNLKVKLGSSVSHTATLVAEAGKYASEFCNKLNNKLQSDQANNTDQIIEDIIRHITERVSNKIYGLVINIANNQVHSFGINPVMHKVFEANPKDKYIDSNKNQSIEHKGNKDTHNHMLKQAYDLLGIRQDASETEIRRAYLTNVLESHPDRNLNNQTKANKNLAEINVAHDLIQENLSTRTSDSNLSKLRAGQKIIHPHNSLENSCMLSNLAENFFQVPESKLSTKTGIWNHSKGSNFKDAEEHFTKLNLHPVKKQFDSKAITEANIRQFIRQNNTDRALTFVRFKEEEMGHVVVVKKLDEQFFVLDSSSGRPLKKPLEEFLKDKDKFSKMKILVAENLDNHLLDSIQQDINNNNNYSSSRNNRFTGNEDNASLYGINHNEVIELIRPHIDSSNSGIVAEVAAKKMIKQMEEANITINLKVENLLKILNNPSEGVKNNSQLGIASHERISGERELFKIPMNALPIDRPIYGGYNVTNSEIGAAPEFSDTSTKQNFDSSKGEGPVHYGGTHIVTKQEVKNRATFTPTDSLQQLAHEKHNNSVLDQKNIITTPLPVHLKPSLPIINISSNKENMPRAYIKQSLTIDDDLTSISQKHSIVPNLKESIPIVETFNQKEIIKALPKDSIHINKVDQVGNKINIDFSYNPGYIEVQIFRDKTRKDTSPIIGLEDIEEVVIDIGYLQENGATIESIAKLCEENQLKYRFIDTKQEMEEFTYLPVMEENTVNAAGNNIPTDD